MTGVSQQPAPLASFKKIRSMKILVATEKPFAPAAVEQIREVTEAAGHELVLLEKYSDASELHAAVADADALIVRSDKVTASVVEAAKNLKIVVRAGAGYDNLDLDACTAKGVVAMNTPGQNSNAVAELVFQMMLYNARNGFKGKAGTELRGKSIGIHAFGWVGKNVARIARGFEMNLFGFDPFADESEMRDAGVEPCGSAEELYSKCQYISLHIPANEKTVKSVNRQLLMSMPAGATLVNTARKEVIDEDGLVDVMKERDDFSYLSDIAPDNRALLEENFPGRFIFTDKKMGAQTKEANINAGVAAARQIADFFATGNEQYRVN